MKFSIIASRKDKAGMNISEELEKLGFKINYFDKEIIYAENIDKTPDLENSDFIIFISKHESAKKIKSLSVHAPGNFEKAEFGGREGKICRTSGLFLKHIFKILNKKAEKSKLDHQVTLEVTHHGPYIETPCIFIEIGSSEKEWRDKRAGRITAETIKEAIKTFNEEEANKKYKTAIGISSPHYCPNFSKIQLNSEIAISHIIPSYNLPITEQMLKEAINKTQEKVNLAILDWKSMKSGERQETIKLLNKLNLKYKRTSDIKK